MEDAIDPSIVDRCTVHVGDERCDRRVHHQGLQLCNAHNLQRLRGIPYKMPRRRKGIPDYLSTPCSEEKCDLPSVSLGLCDSHYYYHRNGLGLPRLHTRRRPKGSCLERNDLGEKECARCRRWVPEEGFGFSSKSFDGLRGECKECRKAVYKVKNPTTPKEHVPTAKSLSNHGKDRGWFETTFNGQGRKCAICESPTPTKKGWSLDHDHSCCPGGKSCGECVRGILCSNCNTSLGLMKENIEALTKMIDYLEDNNDRS